MSFLHYPKYMDSRVEWLGDVPEGWEIKPVKRCTTYNDEVLPENTPETYEIKYVEISDVDDQRGIVGSTIHTFRSAPSRARRVVKNGDIIISTVRTYLRAIAQVNEPPENMVCSTGFAVIRSMPRCCETTFLGYALRAEWFISEVIADSVGVSYPAINASDLVNIRIPVPSLPEQTQIARFLDHETARIDALIEEQQRLITLLKEKRQAVISHAVTKGLDPTVRMKDSGVEWLGEVPEHWEVSRLKFLLRDIKAGPFGSSLTKEMYVPEGYRVYGQEQVIPGDFSIGDYFISTERFNELTQYEVLPGDVLVSCVGTYGKVAIAPIDIPKGIINPRLIRLRAQQDIVPEYLKELLQSHVVFQQFSSYSRGGTMDVINIGTLSEIVIAVPPISDQLQVLESLNRHKESVDSLVEEAAHNITLLKERRAALISAAVTGKIDVRDWQPPADQPSTTHRPATSTAPTDTQTYHLQESPHG